ncbi:hypothetical protein BKA70DRAFT_1400390 [Coprinopsis sp. MPI-PUGE-AT-0042]|nr:hypothetical protein BKA70DRAFT_1400390 [Coprinopsis sp. MPI-PUGE-AT-0042]
MEINARILAYTWNNEPLPDELKPLLDAQCEEAETCISACDARIGEIREQMIKAQGEDVEALRLESEHQHDMKNEFCSTLWVLSSTTSAVRRLPPEIIALVITFSVWDDSGRLQSRCLARICRVSWRWRHMALSMPSLWRVLSVQLWKFSDRSHKEATALFANTLNSWLSRAGDGGPITLSFSLGSGARIPGTSERPRTCDLIDWIRTSHFKFVALKFFCIFKLTTELHALFSSNAPSLHSIKELYLDLILLEWPSSLEIIPIIDIKSTMPNLSCLTLTGASFSEPFVDFIHSSLAKLQLIDMEINARDVIEMVRRLPALQSLSLDSCWMPTEEEQSTGDEQRPYIHRGIREIRLSTDLYGQFFGELICPALERLTLSHESPHGDGVDDDSAKALGQFIQRSDASGITLHLSGTFPSDFINALLSASSPKIQGLHLEAPSCLPLGNNAGGPRLVLPSSVHCIQCVEVVPEDEATSWMKQLALRLEYPSHQTITVQFGEGETAYARRPQYIPVKLSLQPLASSFWYLRTMATNVEIDARITPYTCNNDPLPDKLKPILDIQLEKLRTAIPACDVPINEEEDKISECKHKIQALNDDIASSQAEVERQVEAKIRHGNTIRTLNTSISVRVGVVGAAVDGWVVPDTPNLLDFSRPTCWTENVMAK